MRISDWSSDVCSSDLTMMVTAITLDNIEHLAIGSSFLGTGGGGDPYLGSLLCREAIAKFGPVRVMSVDELSDDDNVFIAAAMGAPTVMIEKLFRSDEHTSELQSLMRISYSFFCL